MRFLWLIPNTIFLGFFYWMFATGRVTWRRDLEETMKRHKPTFVAFTNRDTGKPDCVRIDAIWRVMSCPNPEHEGFALLWLKERDEKGNHWVIEADMQADEFIEMLGEETWS